MLLKFCLRLYKDRSKIAVLYIADASRNFYITVTKIYGEEGKRYEENIVSGRFHHGCRKKQRR